MHKRKLSIHHVVFGNKDVSGKNILKFGLQTKLKILQKHVAMDIIPLLDHFIRGLNSLQSSNLNTSLSAYQCHLRAFARHYPTKHAICLYASEVKLCNENSRTIQTSSTVTIFLAIYMTG